MSPTRYNLLPAQTAFLESKARYGLLRGGYGSGKTFGICLYALYRIITWPGSIGIVAANSYKQLNSATMATLFKLFDDTGIKYRFNKLEQRVYLENGSILALYSLENYDDLRGIEVSFAIVDEVAYSTINAWNTLIARVRKKGFGPLEVRAATTPRGYNFIYQMFKGEGKTHYHEEFYSDPRLNTNLEDGYLEGLKASFDPLTYKQEVLGEYVAETSGLKYHAFDFSHHVERFDLDGLAKMMPGAAGCDFNVDPITAVVGWYIGQTYYIADEIYKRNSNTFELADLLEAHPYNVSDVYPDAAGKQRKTSSTQTDHEILRNKGFNIYSYRANKAIRDRVNTVNWLFSQNRLKIHPNCKNLIKDLSAEEWLTKDKMLGHVADGLGYWLHYNTPMVGADRGNLSQTRF